MNTKGSHGNISKDIKSFYDYVNNHIVNSDFTRQIDDEISYLKLDSKVRREFMLLEARLLDERREGKSEGKAEGIAEEKLATAKRLLSMGLSVQDVAKGTSLSVEQVEKLRLNKLDSPPTPTAVRCRERLFTPAQKNLPHAAKRSSGDFLLY